MSARDVWSAAQLPAVIVPHAIGAAAAAALRARLEHAGYTRYALLDRGSYDVISTLDEPALFTALAGVASEITQCDLHIADARALRLLAGDYLLVRHDKVHDDEPVELMLDLSPASVPGAAVHYRHRGQVFFVVPSEPGSLAIVRRGPTVMCNHTYVSKLHPDASIVRVVLLLKDAGAAKK